jgi:DNA mismatch repair protein MutL
MDGRGVNALSTDLSQYIRSSAAISSYKNIIEECLLNSLDARSTKIELYTDITNFHIKVIDNGVGISRDALSLVGEFNATSKSVNTSYGCKGEALAAFSTICKVEIISKERSSDKCYAKKLYGDRAVRENNRSSRGTTVIVSDIFYNIPVRRKASNVSSELGKIKELVNKMAILHYGVSLMLYDYGSKKLLLNIPQDISPETRVIRLHSASVFATMTV